MDSTAIAHLLRAAHSVVHAAEAGDDVDAILEQILTLVVHATDGALVSLAVGVVNPRGRVRYSAQTSRTSDTAEPVETAAVFVEPMAHDTVSVHWTAVAGTNTLARHTCDSSTVDVTDVLDHMTAVIAHAVDVLSLRAAIEHRDELATAKGILMERNSIDADDAFSMLARHSQNTNIKVAVLARHVIAAQ